MKRRVAVLVMAAGLVGLTGFVIHASRKNPPPATRSVEVPAAALSAGSPGTRRPGGARSQAGAASPEDRGYFIPVTGGKPQLRDPIDPFPRVPKSRNGLPLAGDPFVAESPQEQAWLDRNGYPNAQQLAAYSAASDLELEQAAAHGDSVAAVELAARQLARGDPSASGKLMTAGANGSSYALSLLASYMASAGHGNPELGYALSRVLEMRGDWRAPLTRDIMFREPLSPVEKMRAEVEALKLFQQLDGGPGGQPRTDPRPLDWKIQAAGGTTAAPDGGPP